MKKRALIILFVLAGSFLVFPYAAGAVSFDTHVRKGMDAYRSKAYQIAYDHFLQAFDIVPDHFAVNFYLGRAAHEIGNYEMAVMVFERALIISPGDNRVKLEMARAFYKLGVTHMARKNCNEVLLSDPPQSVKENIERFLAYIDRSEQRHFFRGAVSLGLDWNDNVWTSPSNNTISTVLGRVSLTGPSAEKIEDFIYSAVAELDHTYSFLHSLLAWQTQGIAYKALYQEENDLDTLYLSLETGPDYIFKKGVAGLRFTADYMDLDNEKYSEAAGVRGFYRHIFTPSLVVTPGLSWQNRSFKSNVGRQGDIFCFDVNTAFLIENVWYSTTLGVEQKTARDNEYGYDRYILEFSASREFSSGITLFGSYAYTYSAYAEAEDWFDSPRRDNIHTAGCGIKKRLWQSPDRRKRLSISLGYSFTRADANLDLYDYRKNIINSVVEYRF